MVLCLTKSPNHSLLIDLQWFWDVFATSSFFSEAAQLLTAAWVSFFQGFKKKHQFSLKEKVPRTPSVSKKRPMPMHLFSELVS